MKHNEKITYLQSVTDSLAGHKLQLCAAVGDVEEIISTEADRLRKVWEMVDILNPPEADEAMLERIYRQVVTLAATGDIDDDELDWAVGAAKSPEVDPDDSNKKR